VTDSTICRYCRGKLSHLEGSTGRVSICTRCGWNRVKLARGRRIPGLRTRDGSSAVPVMVRDS
jgi:hypothetical protein